MPYTHGLQRLYHLGGHFSFLDSSSVDATFRPPYVDRLEMFPCDRLSLKQIIITMMVVIMMVKIMMRLYLQTQSFAAW